MEVGQVLFLFHRTFPLLWIESELTWFLKIIKGENKHVGVNSFFFILDQKLIPIVTVWFCDYLLSLNWIQMKMLNENCCNVHYHHQLPGYHQQVHLLIDHFDSQRWKEDFCFDDPGCCPVHSFHSLRSSCHRRD